MKYSNEQIIERLEAGENLKYLFFWGHTKIDSVSKSCLSQWYEAAFEINKVVFPTAEHYMMAEKALLFDDIETYNRIIHCKSPGEAKKLGRQVKFFNQSTWEANRFEIVVRGNFHKFSQNPALATFLKNTKQRILVEASPVDNIWGIGLTQDNPNIGLPYYWKGLNLLGYALMETRNLLNGLGDFKQLNNPVLPPWLAHPEIEPGSIGWRMGYGEDHMIKLSKYFNELSESEQLIYQLTFPARGDWKDWYL